MREIKFRAWDKEEQEMIYGIEATPLHFYEYLEMENFMVMQYTGLKDKNDKEIYEGDIVKQWDGIKQIIFEDFMWAAVEKLGEVVNSSCEEMLPFISNDCEVIGNIYENKELLDDNTK